MIKILFPCFFLWVFLSSFFCGAIDIPPPPPLLSKNIERTEVKDWRLEESKKKEIPPALNPIKRAIDDLSDCLDREKKNELFSKLVNLHGLLIFLGEGTSDNISELSFSNVFIKIRKLADAILALDLTINSKKKMSYHLDIFNTLFLIKISDLEHLSRKIERSYEAFRKNHAIPLEVTACLEKSEAKILSCIIELKRIWQKKLTIEIEE